MATAARPACFIGIDLGTSGCRASAIDNHCVELASSSESLPRLELQTPDHWWRATRRVVAELLRKIADHQPLALSVDGTSTSLLLRDKRNRPVSPVLMYNDGRARAQAGLLAECAPKDTPVHSPTDSLPKLLWLSRKFPAVATQACHQSEWVLSQFAGNALPGDENNCLKLGYDPVARKWPEWLQETGLSEKILPQVVPAGTPLTRVAKDAMYSTGLPTDCLLVAGTTDSTAAALATGISEPGDATTALGSTLVIKMLSSVPLFDASHGVYSHRIHGHWLVGGASNTGGAVLRQYFSDAQIDRLTTRMDPTHPTGLDYYPLPGPGERFPHRDPDMAPRMEPVPEDPALFLQALLEGITQVEATGYQLLQRLGCPRLRQVYTTGGGSINPAWQQMRQNALAVPVIRAAHAEASYGSALLARSGYLQSRS